LLPQVSARVWGAEWADYDDRRAIFRGSVRLDLAEPHMIVPANVPPSPAHRLLPRGNAIQVAGEEKHLDALAPFLRPEGECWVYVTLHEMVEQLARSTRSVVEVRVDDARVGQLTPKMSGELIPALRHLAEHGEAAAARAVIRGNRIKAEVVLYVARTHELPDSWLVGADSARPNVASTAASATGKAAPAATAHAMRQHGPIPPPPTAIRFVVPPEWPSPPASWIPPAGWRPDPSWPPAPADWQWWVPAWD
jgi:collagen type III alpha